MHSAAPVIEALGWTLLHFLWQGTAVAALLWPALRLLRRAAPAWRYAAAALAMVAMLAMAATTLVRQWPQEKVSPTPPVTARVQAEPGNVQSRPSTPSASEPPASPLPLVEPSAPELLPQPTLVPAPEISWQTVAETLRPHLRWIVGAWALGVALVLVRLGHGWWFLNRLRNTAATLSHSQWTARFAEIAHALRVSRSVRLLSSATARVPMVIGWMKPVVIVPAALFAGLPAAQLEAILAHELAHIRRHDYLVNLLQCVVEALFFYHPAVWWVSAQLRKEREHCCDDIASRLCGGALPYARALTALEELRGTESVLGLAAGGRPLLQRIRRLVGVRDTTAFGWPAAIAALAAAILLPLGVLLAAEKPAAEGEISLPRTTEGAAAIATSKHGTWTFPNGVTLRLYGEVFHATDVLTTALVTWDARDGRPAMQWHTSIASDAFANRERWAVAWEKDKPVLWVACRDIASSSHAPDGRPVANRFKRLDLTDPAHIREDYFQNGWPEKDPPSAAVAAEMLALMEVPAEGSLSSTVHSWAALGSLEKIPLQLVENIHIDATGTEFKVQLSPDERRCTPSELASILKSMSTAWRSSRARTLGELAPIPRVTISLPATDAEPRFAAVVQACGQAGVGPALAAAPSIRGLSLAGMPSTSDRATLTELFEPVPGKPGEIRPKLSVFSMSLGEVGPWLMAEVNVPRFWIEVRPDPKVVADVIYGPIDGSPVEMLDLAGWLRGSDALTDPGYARRVACDMIRCGDDRLGPLALGWFENLQQPSPPDQHDDVIRALEERLRSHPKSHTAQEHGRLLEKLTQLKRAAISAWESERQPWPEGYSTGEPLEKLPAAVTWGEPAENGLRLGVAGVADGATWPLSAEQEVTLFVRNDGTQSVKFAWTPRPDDGVELTLTDASGGVIRASVAIFDTPLHHNHSELAPGHFIALKRPLTFLVSDVNAGDDDDRSAFAARFSLERAGTYRLDVRCHLGIRDWVGTGGHKIVRPRGEWEGTLASRPLSVVITSAAAAETEGLAFGPAREDGLRAAWKLDPTKDAYQVGEIVKCAVVFHNAGKAPVTFETDAWHQFDKWNATRADGSRIDVRTTWFTGITPQEKVTLQPGESREIPAHGVGIGQAEFAERYGKAELGAELWAQPGDDVTCVWDVQLSPSSGETLKTGPVTFKVTAAPPPQEPRPPVIADHLGSYDIGKGSILHLSQVGSAEGYTNYAWITWEMARGAESDAKADIAMPRSADPKDSSIPTFIVSRTVPALWIIESTGLRKIDFAKAGSAAETKWAWKETPADFGGAPADVQDAIRKHAGNLLTAEPAKMGLRAFLEAQRQLGGEPRPEVARAWKAQETNPHQEGRKTAAVYLFPKGVRIFVRCPEDLPKDPMFGSWKYCHVKELPGWLTKFGCAKTDVIAIRADDNAEVTDLKNIIPTLDEAGWGNIALLTGEPGPQRSCAARLRTVESELGLPFTGSAPKATATVHVAADGSYTFDGTHETLEQAATRLQHVGATDATIEIIVKADAQAPYAAVAALLEKAKEAGLTKVSVTTEEAAKPSADAGLIRSASDVALRFFKAGTPAERVALLDLDDAGRKAATSFLEKHPLAAEPKAVIEELGAAGEPAVAIIPQPDGSEKVKLMVDLPEAGVKHMVVVGLVDGKPLIEWETSTVFQAGQYADVLTAAPGETRQIVATAKRDDYYNRTFSDADRLVCHKLSYGTVPTTLFGYVDKDSPLAAKLAAATGQVAMTVEVPEGNRDANQVRIVDVADGATAKRSPLELRLVAERATETTEDVLQAAQKGQPETHLPLEKDAIVTAADVKEAVVDGAQTGELRWTVRVKLTEAAGERLREFTAKHRGRQLAIVAGGKIVSAPKIMDTIGRDVAISGNFDEAEAKRLAEAIKPQPKPQPAPAPDNALRLDVIDAATKAPLKNFRVLAGVPSSVSSDFEKAEGVSVINWQPHTIREGADGTLTWPLERAYDTMALRVEADGFVPQIVAGIEKKNGGRAISLELVKDEGIRGSVMTPENKRPAHDATVVLAMIGRNARLKGSGFPELQLKSDPKSLRDAWERPLTVTPDEKGEFTLPTEVDPTAVVLILHGDGVLELPYAKWKANPNVTLQRWGRIHGRVRWGAEAGVGQKVSLIANHGDEHGYPDIVSQYDDTPSLEGGIFVFERVLPGLCQLSCPIQATKDNASGITEVNLTGQLTHATVVPSPPVTPVVIGGVGRTVRGKLTGRASWDGVTFHLHPTAPHIGLPGDDEKWKAWSELQKSPQGAQFFRSGLKVAADGTFEIPALLPGSYQIFFSRQDGKERVASSQFSVPAEKRDEAPEPMTLPDIKL